MRRIAYHAYKDIIMKVIVLRFVPMVITSTILPINAVPVTIQIANVQNAQLQHAHSVPFHIIWQKDHVSLLVQISIIQFKHYIVQPANHHAATVYHPHPASPAYPHTSTQLAIFVSFNVQIIKFPSLPLSTTLQLLLVIIALCLALHAQWQSPIALTVNLVITYTTMLAC